MKRVLFLICGLLLFTQYIQAQKLTVESMTVATNDISASTSRRMDLNGQPCGLVKVQLAASGAVFDGSIIQPVEYKTGEYWVYMTEGSYMLQIKHPDFLPLNLNFRDYGIKKVEPKTTYILTILKPQAYGDTGDSGSQFLVLTVTPKNAVVKVDGEQQTVKDGVAKVMLPYGQHSYLVEAVGYASESRTVNITRQPSRFKVDLQSVMAMLTVECPTVGSKVYVNDELKGSAPWRGALAKGTYLVEARCDGYRSSSKSVTLANNEQHTVLMPALQRAAGSISVDYDPVDAEVWIDNQKKGTTPSVFHNIGVGEHKVEIRANGYVTAALTVDVREGETTILKDGLNKVSTTVASNVTNTTSSNSSGKITIKGKVVDNHKEALIGASCVIVGSRTGTVTDIGGNFTMTVPNNSTIRISYVGYDSQEFRVNGNRSVYTITLKENKLYKRFGLGLSAGLNFVGGNYKEQKTKMGYQAGLDATYALRPRFGLQSGIFYSLKGIKLNEEKSSVVSETHYAEGSSWDASYIQIPLQLYYSPYIPSVSLKFSAGAYAAFGIGGSCFEKDVWAYEKFDYGLQFGLTFSVRKRGWNNFYLKAGFEQSLVTQSDYPEKSDFKFNTFSIGLGYRL